MNRACINISFFCLLLFYLAGEQEVFECKRNKNKNFPNPKPTYFTKFPLFSLLERIALVSMIEIVKFLSQQFIIVNIEISKNRTESNNFDVAQRQRD
jgi:hypothetical protein